MKNDKETIIMTLLYKDLIDFVALYDSFISNSCFTLAVSIWNVRIILIPAWYTSSSAFTFPSNATLSH